MAHDGQPGQTSLIAAGSGGPEAHAPALPSGSSRFLPRKPGKRAVSSARFSFGAGASATSLAIVALATLLQAAPTSAQNLPEDWRELLERVVSAADRFTERQGQPPVFHAYRVDPVTGQETLTGYAFLTSDLPPEQRGFDGAIEVLVGMDLGGVLTGIAVTRYNESLRRSRGDFLARGGFQEQFTGKSILDAFQVRRDVDGITGATITVDAMSRGIRNAAREVAVAHRLGSVSAASEAPLLDAVSVALEELERLSWTEMLLRGLGQQLLVLDDDRTATDLTLVYLRDEAVADILIGPGILEEALEGAGPLAGERHLVLAGVDGPLAGALNLGRLSIVQAGDTVGIGPQEVLLFGPPREGKLDGQVGFVRILLVDRAVDMTQPFTFVLDLRPGLGLFSTEYPGEREVAAQTERAAVELSALSLADDEEETVLSRTLAGTSWARVAALLALLSLATAAFMTKRAWLRWVTLGATLVFLGIIDKGFLSVSHITSVIRVGPEVLLADLPLLLLVTFTVVTTLLWGRVFCGFLCPFGVLQDLLERIVPRWRRHLVSGSLHRRAALAKYAVLALVVSPAVLGDGVSLFQYFEPFGTVFFASRSVLLWTIAAGILVASAIVPRFYCRYVCPLGAALALGSLLSPFRIRRVEQCGVCKVCEQRCPTRAIDGAEIDFKECVRCNVCEIKLIEKAGVCRHDMAEVRSRLVTLTMAPERESSGS